MINVHQKITGRIKANAKRPAQTKHNDQIANGDKMKQMTMTQLVKAVKAGANLAEIAPEGADLKYLQKIIDNVDLNKKPAKKRQSRRGLPKKNRNYAEGVLYKRNAFDDKEIPFNGEPVAIGDDGNGLAIGVDY